MKLIFDLETMDLPDIGEFIELAKAYKFELKVIEDNPYLEVSKMEDKKKK